MNTAIPLLPPLCLAWYVTVGLLLLHAGYSILKIFFSYFLYKFAFPIRMSDDFKKRNISSTLKGV